MTKNILATFMLAIFLISPAIAQDGHEGHDHHAQHDHSTHDHSKHIAEPTLIITPIAPSELIVGEENEIILFIQDTEAKPVDISQFEVMHTKPIHLLIADPTLNDYHHKHPVTKGTGQYAFTFTPHTACSYRIWVDVKLKNTQQQYIPVDLKGTEACDQSLTKTANLETSSQGYDFKMQLENQLMENESVLATISISKDGKPVDFLEPVMGAFSHMVGFYEDYKTIAHIHPMDKEPTESEPRGGPNLRFHIEPEHAGYLKLFVQVQIDGKQIFVPFGVIVQ